MFTDTLAHINAQAQEIERLRVWVHEAILLMSEEQREPFMRARGIFLPPGPPGGQEAPRKGT